MRLRIGPVLPFPIQAARSTNLATPRPACCRSVEKRCLRTSSFRDARPAAEHVASPRRERFAVGHVDEKSPRCLNRGYPDFSTMFRFALVQVGMLPGRRAGGCRGRGGRRTRCGRRTSRCALVDLVGVAGGEVGNVKPQWPAGRRGEGGAVEPIDQDRPLADRGQRNAGVKVVARGMQREYCADGLGRADSSSPASVTASPCRLGSIRLTSRPGTTRRSPSDRQTTTPGAFDFAVDREHRWFHKDRCRNPPELVSVSPIRRTVRCLSSHDPKERVPPDIVGRHPFERVAGCSRASSPTILYEQPMLLPQLWQR